MTLEHADAVPQVPVERGDALVEMVCAGRSQILRRAVAVAIEISAIEHSRLLGNLLIPQR